MTPDDGLTVLVRRAGPGWVAECAAPPTAGAARTVAGALTGLAGALALHYNGRQVPPVVVVAGTPAWCRLAGLVRGWRRLLTLDVAGTAAVVAAIAALYALTHGGGPLAVVELAAIAGPVALVALNLRALLLAAGRAPWNLVRRDQLAGFGRGSDALPRGLGGNGCASGR